MTPTASDLAYPTTDAAQETLPASPYVDRRRVFRAVARSSAFAAQIVSLWMLNFAGMWFVSKTAIPIPGNLVGMVALYTLLALGIVKLSWFEAAGSFLVKHLAFFFVPITVGLMDFGPVLAVHGVAIMTTLGASAAIGIFLAGSISQALLRKAQQAGDGA